MAYEEIFQAINEESILADLNRIAIELGLLTEIYEQSRIYVYYSVFSRVMAQLFRVITEYLQNNSIEHCTDEALLEQLIRPFIVKRSARASKVILWFYRRSEVLEEPYDIIIPQFFEVSTIGENPIVFRTAEQRVLWKNAAGVKVVAYSIDLGEKNNVGANTLTSMDDDIYRIIGVTNPESAYNGIDEETAFEARDRIPLFRYDRDGSRSAILNLLSKLGVYYSQFSIVEYWDGSGSLLLCLDVDNDQHYRDLIGEIEDSKVPGPAYRYIQCERIYIDLSVTLKVTGAREYDAYDIYNIQTLIDEAVRIYAQQTMTIGTSLSTKRLESAILRYLVENTYEIYDTELQVGEDSSLDFDSETGEVLVTEYQRLIPNKILVQTIYNEK